MTDNRPSRPTAGMEETQRRRIRDYELVREVGRGGMAIVYLARQHDLNRDVALKELSTFHSADTWVVDRFLRESQLAASLNHPNIVTVHQFFEHEGVPYIAMEYVPQGSLRPYLGTLSLAQFVGVMEGVLAGLAHAENRGVVHRDLKPENLMVTDDGRVKITDFGIAKATVTAGRGTLMTQDGMTVGTPSYMAPEQAVASKDLGPWTDLYSVGVMAYEHLTGRPPFCDDAAAIILFRHVNEAIPRAADVSPDVDPELSAWVDRLLVKDPRDRTRSPVTAWEELEDIVVRRAGALWRRQARLWGATHPRAGARPLTPAPFESYAAVTSAGAHEPGYVTFGRARAVSAPSLTASGDRSSSLSSHVLRLCAQLRQEISDGEAQDAIGLIADELSAADRGDHDTLRDAARAAEALSRLRRLQWTPADLPMVRSRIEAVQESGAEMQLLRLARWWARCAAGEVALPADKRDELQQLLSCGRPDGPDAAYEHVLAWRSYEASPQASPMARRLAGDVVRFYEETAAAS